jgi:peptidoglycan-associated lipoprotein
LVLSGLVAQATLKESKMILKRTRILVTMLTCAAVMLGAAGCRSSKPDADMNATSDVLEGDVGFADRFDADPGRRITGVRFQAVLFGYDSHTIARAEIAKIERVAAYLRKNSRARLVCEGHCDERGTREYNLSLGEHRALGVRAYLVGLGIPAAHIQTRSYGEERPVNPGHTEGAWRQNRRVEFALYR